MESCTGEATEDRLKRTKCIRGAWKKAEATLVCGTRVLRYPEVLHKLDHPHVIKLLDLYEDSRNFYLLLQLSARRTPRESIWGGFGVLGVFREFWECLLSRVF